MSEIGRDGQLPLELVDRLPDQRTRDALGHLTRRQILRGLLENGRLSARDACSSGLVACSLSSASYHLSVLAKAGLIDETDAVQEGGTTLLFFSPAIDRGGPIVEVLRATQDGDQRGLAESAA